MRASRQEETQEHPSRRTFAVCDHISFLWLLSQIATNGVTYNKRN